jgi:DNA processing protein
MTPAQAPPPAPSSTVARLSRRGAPIAEPAATATRRQTQAGVAGAADHEAAALLILTRSGRLAAARYSSLVEAAGSALAVLHRERLEAEAQTSFFTDPEERLAAELSDAAREIAGWRAQGMQLLTVLDPAYPENLKAAYDRPPLIFVAGRLKSPRDDRGVAVVGSRNASGRGLRAAAAMAEHLVTRGHTVVSGLAAGIDTAAHEAALRRGGRTVAVIGTGVAVCYPRANVILQRRIAAQCAVISQFPPDTPPARENFPLRNAVMSGFALASVIVEASPTSGTRIVARSALAQGRPLFLFEPVLEHRWARELAELPAVHVVETPSEVTETIERLTSTDALVA